jgi:hypothetical protein
MTDLLVDFTTLEDSHRAAQTLKSEFDGLPHRVGDGAHWGHHDVHDAMHEFGTNWDYHRKILSGKIGEAGEKIESCLTTFRDADQQLYDQLKKSTEQSGGK